MISAKGYGIVFVLLDYFGGIYLLGRISDSVLRTDTERYFVLLAFHIVITIFNYLLFKFLNRNEVKHAVFELKLENVCLFAGITFLVLLLLMGKDIIY